MQELVQEELIEKAKMDYGAQHTNGGTPGADGSGTSAWQAALALGSTLPREA